MARLVTPLTHRTLWATGDGLLRAKLRLSLKTDRGIRVVETFLVDSGSEMTTMPAHQARQLGLPMPQRAAPGVRHHPTGLVIRSGLLRARVVGMDATEYVFPCLFLGDPDTPIAGHGGIAPRKLLGLAGVVNQLRLAFDGQTMPGALYGNLIVEKV
jgi:hypothetical protein